MINNAKSILNKIEKTSIINFIFQSKFIIPVYRGSRLIIKSFRNFSEFHINNLPKKDLYKILELTPNSEQKEIKQAYYKKAKELHPDKVSDSSSQTKKINAEESFKEAKIAYDILSNQTSRKDYDKYIYSLYFNQDKKEENFEINSCYYDNYNKGNSHFSNYGSNNTYETFYYDAGHKKYYKSTRSSFTFIDPKTGKVHRININKSEKTDTYDNDAFYKNEELKRANSKKSQENNFYDDFKSSSYYSKSNSREGSDNNFRNYNDLNFRSGKKNFDSYDGNIYYDKNEEKFIFELGFKHYLTFVFIIVTLVSFFLFLKKNPPYGDPFVYQNSIYYPKNNDPLMAELIKEKKIDAYMLYHINQHRK